MLFHCKSLALNILNTAAINIASSKKVKGPQPHLAIILVGDNKASKTYVKRKLAECEQVGAKATLHHLEAHDQLSELHDLIANLNATKNVHGILLQLPLPDHFKKHEHDLIQQISPLKDIDRLTAQSMGELLVGRATLLPPTTNAVFKIIEAFKINLTGKDVVVLGQGTLVGRPVANELINRMANVHIFNSQSDRANIAHVMKNTEILITGTGVKNPISPSLLHKDLNIIDVGIHFNKEGKIQGDFDAHLLQNRVKMITPVPGGVGLLTVACLIENLVKLAKS